LHVYAEGFIENFLSEQKGKGLLFAANAKFQIVWFQKISILPPHRRVSNFLGGGGGAL